MPASDVGSTLSRPATAASPCGLLAVTPFEGDGAMPASDAGSTLSRPATAASPCGLLAVTTFGEDAAVPPATRFQGNGATTASDGD